MQEIFLFPVFRTKPGSHGSPQPGGARRTAEGWALSLSRVRLSSPYFGTTELTVMVSPSRVPVTVAVFPACLSRVARAVLSVVSSE